MIKTNVNFFNLGKKIDQFSWTTFFAPFHWKLWLGLTILCILVSVMIWIFHQYPKGSKTISILEAFMNSTASMFGIGLLDANDPSSTKSARLSLFVIFICTSIIFYVYGGFLTSILAVPTEYKPFNNPEDLLKTTYR